MVGLRGYSFACALVMLTLMVPDWLAARAAELNGVQLPETVQVDGKALRLNGYGQRSFSLLGIHIYVASLYLEHLSTDPEAILRSPETKLLRVRFQRGVSAERARRAWRDGLENNCIAPCHLDPQDVERFLAQVPAMEAGDDFALLFTQNGAVVTVGGKLIGTISQPQFAEAMLATFLGPKPGAPSLKQELLRGHS
jgi:Chalcone isomerase-like